MNLRISQLLSLNCVSWTLFIFLWSTAFSDNALKNHRAEKRQDNSFLFFGGWRPLKSRNPYYQGAASTRFHDILSALPHSYDTSASYYTHALPTQQYHKDIYSYYPRPAIKSTPKKNTPVYMERFRPQKQQQKQGSRGVSYPAQQFIDFPNIDFRQLKEIHEAIIHTKDLPIAPLNLPIESAKPLEIVQISLDALQPGIQNYGFGGSSNVYGRPRNVPRGRKSGNRRIPQGRRPSIQSPIEYKYISLPKTAPTPIIPQIHPKEIEITQIQLPQHGVTVDEVVDVKNVQIIEVPQIVSYGVPNGKGGSKSQYSGKSSTRSTQQYKTSAQSSPQKSAPVFSYYAHQTEQPRHTYPPPQKSNQIQHQPQIEAELVKLSEEDLKHLLSNLQVLDKDHQDVLKYVPLNNIGHLKDENIQLVVSLPEAERNQGGNQNYRPESGYSKSQYGGDNKQYEAEPQPAAYPTKESSSYEQNGGSYQNIEHNNIAYQVEEPRSNGIKYEHANYQTVEQQSGYDHHQGYQNSVHQESKGNYEKGGQQYSKSNSGASKEQSGAYGEQEPSYIQVVPPHADENGYRREPVLAIEIQHGQTIEEAIKALDRETLAKLGTHGKNGIEIEVVEVPVDDYVSESQQTETVVSPKNTTVLIRAKKTKEEKS